MTIDNLIIKGGVYNDVDQEFLPTEICGSTFYHAGTNAREQEIKERLDRLWKGKYK